MQSSLPQGGQEAEQERRTREEVQGFRDRPQSQPSVIQPDTPGSVPY